MAVTNTVRSEKFREKRVIMRRVAAAETSAIRYWSLNAKKNPCGALCEAGEGPRGNPERTPRPTQNRAGAREQGHPTHRERERKGSGWKSGDVSDGDVASDVTSHTMVSTITTIKRMVIAVCHHDPVAWHGTDLYKKGRQTPK